jgi:imidazolonepropionase-like amidohydrolase
LAAVVALLFVGVAAHAAPEQTSPLYVTAREVHTGTGEVFRPGAVAVVDGKIQAVGKPEDVAVPAGARRIEGAAVVPGLVAAQTEHVSKGGEDPNSVATDVRAIDGYDFAVPETRLLAGGVTTIFLSPGSNRVVTGRGAVVKTAGASRETRTLRADTGWVAGIGESVARPPAVLDPPVEPDATNAPLQPWRRQFPVTRAGSVMLLRKLFETTTSVGEVRIGADSAGDLEAALALAKEKSARAVIVGGRDAGTMAAALKESGLPVVLRWPVAAGRVNAPWDADAETAALAGRRNAAVLADAGVPFALAAGEESAQGDLLFFAAAAAREGLAPAKAVAAITSEAAKILGVGDRVGTLAPGRDADLVVLSGAPADLRTFAMTTVVDGAVAWERGSGGKTVVVRAATVFLGDGHVLSPGEVAFENGKIVEVGPSVGVPPGARFIDLPGGSVTPGFIDAFSHAGMAGEGGRPSGDLSTAVTAAKAFTANDASFAVLASQGVTTALASPGGGGGRVAGRAAVLKTFGADDAKRVVDDDAALVVRLRGDRDIAAASKELDDLLKKAKEYKESLEKFEKDKKEWDAWKKARDDEEAKKKASEAAKPKDDAKKDGDPKAESGKEEKPPEKKDEAKKDEKAADEKTEPAKPKTDEALAGWLPALEKKVPVFVQVRTVEEIRAALALLSDEWKLRVVLVGADDARHALAAIEKAKAGVVAGPIAMAQERDTEVNLLREIAISGVPAAVGSDSWLGGAELPGVLAFAVTRGLSPSMAVRLVTGDAAKLLGVADRVGTIAPGRDADLVLFTGEPFGEGSSVRAVFVGGEEVTSVRR